MQFKWYKKEPGYRTLTGWDEWRTKTKKAHPIQFFFREDVVNFFYSIGYKLSRMKWWVLHRTFYRFHVIKIRSLPPGYYDPETQIRAAAFDIMSEYAETLKGDGIKGTKWTQEDIDAHDINDEGTLKILMEQIDRESEIVALRDWWVEYRPRRDNTERDLLMAIDFDSDKNPRPGSEEYDKFLTWCELEDKQKFIELIDLLPFMWH